MKYFLSLMFVFLSLPVFAKVVVLDVRTPEEYADGHIEGSLNIDVNNKDFAKKITALNKDDTYKIYCRSGRRSGKALDQMKSMGFKDLENLGGYEDARKILEKNAP